MRDSSGVPDCLVRECGDVEVAAELAVDAHEEIAIERGGHTERIVVGKQQLVGWLHEIGTEEQRVSSGEEASNAVHEGARARPIVVADIRSQKQHQGASGTLTALAHVPQPGLGTIRGAWSTRTSPADPIARDVASSALAETSTT